MRFLLPWPVGFLSAAQRKVRLTYLVKRICQLVRRARKVEAACCTLFAAVASGLSLFKAPVELPQGAAAELLSSRLRALSLLSTFLYAAVKTSRAPSAAADPDSTPQPTEKQRPEEEAPGIALFGGAQAAKGRRALAAAAAAAEPPVIRSNDPHEVTAPRCSHRCTLSSKASHVA